MLAAAASVTLKHATAKAMANKAARGLRERAGDREGRDRDGRGWNQDGVGKDHVFWEGGGGRGREGGV